MNWLIKILYPSSTNENKFKKILDKNKGRLYEKSIGIILTKKLLSFKLHFKFAAAPGCRWMVENQSLKAEKSSVQLCPHIVPASNFYHVSAILDNGHAGGDRRVWNWYKKLYLRVQLIRLSLVTVQPLELLQDVSVAPLSPIFCENKLNFI